MKFIVVQVDRQVPHYDVVDSQAEFHTPLATFYNNLDAEVYAILLNNRSVVNVKYELREGDETGYGL